MTQQPNPAPEDCKWHEGDEPLPDDYEYNQGCQYCGRAYDTRDCPICGKTFLDWWSPAPAFHDVFVFPRVTSSGDMACSRCIKELECGAEREAEENKNYYPDPFEGE